MFNFWPFNVARKRREEAHRQAQERLIAAFREDCQQRAKCNKVVPVSDPRHPRNLSPQQRADKLAREAERHAVIRAGFAKAGAEAERAATSLKAFGMVYQGNHRGPAHSIPTHDNLPKVIGVDYASGPDQTVVQQFRCDHPAISEFWQQQQERCDSPTDTSSPSCDAPPTDS